MLAEDRALAPWLIEQVQVDLSYLMIDLSKVRENRSLAPGEASQAERGYQGRLGGLPGNPDGGPERPPPAGRRGRAETQRDASDVTRRVSVVHGRDSSLARRFFDLLLSVYLRPLEWEELVTATGSTAPYLGQVVARAPHVAQATLVLLTPTTSCSCTPTCIRPATPRKNEPAAGRPGLTSWLSSAWP
jgi:hypothetical protein